MPARCHQPVILSLGSYVGRTQFRASSTSTDSPHDLAGWDSRHPQGDNKGIPGRLEADLKTFV